MKSYKRTPLSGPDVAGEMSPLAKGRKRLLADGAARRHARSVCKRHISCDLALSGSRWKSGCWRGVPEAGATEGCRVDQTISGDPFTSFDHRRSNSARGPDAAVKRTTPRPTAGLHPASRRAGGGASRYPIATGSARQRPARARPGGPGNREFDRAGGAPDCPVPRASRARAPGFAPPPPAPSLPAAHPSFRLESRNRHATR